MLKGVCGKVRTGGYANEATFRQEFLEALKNEIGDKCGDEARKMALDCILEYHVRGRGRADVRIGSVLFEFEVPPRQEEKISGGKRTQLEDYMVSFKSQRHSPMVYGVVSNGWFLEIYQDNLQNKIMTGTLTQGVDALITILCVKLSKIDIVEASDFTSIFGLWRGQSS